MKKQKLNVNFIEQFYCEGCQKDFDRMNYGYNPHNYPCTSKWKDKFLNFIQCIIFGIILIPLVIVFIPIITFLILYDKARINE